MAIEKNGFKFVVGARLDSEFSSLSREESMSSEENVLQRLENAESDDDGDEYQDYDSGAGSDDFDLLELGENGEEFCQIGDQTCCIPFELYDLPGLEHILSMDVWNNILTDDDRLNLSKYLPDMDQETFLRTMKELFSCCNFHFGVPSIKLFDMLKGGLCEPRVALYRQGLGYFQKRRHYYGIRKHQNTMVNNIFHIRDSWMKCRGYGIEEKLRALNIMKSQKTLMYEKMEEQDTGSSDWEEYGDGFRSKKKAKVNKQKRVYNHRSSPTFDFPIRGKRLALEPADYVKQNPKGTMKVSGSKISMSKESGGCFPSCSVLPRQITGKFRGEFEEKRMYEIDKAGKKFNGLRGEDYPETSRGLPLPLETDIHAFGRNRTVNQSSDIKVLTAKPSNTSFPYDYVKKLKHPGNNQQIPAEDPTIYGEFRGPNPSKMDGRGIEPFWHNKSQGEPGLKMLEKGEEMEFNSLQQFGEDDDEDNPLIRSNWAYPSSVSSIKSVPDFKKAKFGMKNRKNVEVLDDSRQASSKHMNNNIQTLEAYAHDHPGMNNIGLSGCNSVSNKRKVKEELMSIEEQEDHDFMNANSWNQHDEYPENKSQKKPFTLITPTVHTGFSFSIIHLLSAVRMAMITLLPEDSQDISNSGPSKLNVPCLTVQEIVNRVKSNPGDPCILETQEPLHDLVRGVLKILLSKAAPLGAKGWKTLVFYDKSIKSWSWVGPVSQSSSDHDATEEVTSPDAWGLPYKMLVKLVDSFANWLKSGQETLQQIGSLPAPPLTLMQLNLDEKERFRDLKAQKSLNTINQSSEEIKDYFRKEEFLRYSIPDRAFSYTAIDGKKSTVAPSKKGAGKPTSKARDHFMLKRDRPPHVTILCLVRDAAARLPGSIGTRADVCTLIRDSQYIVEDVSDAQVNQVVSGALDRLHYERDPCVQFDGERKLWVYLHREREEEDFEDDATSSTKKWKRQKKECIESSDPGAGTTEQSGFDLGSDLNLEPSGVSEHGAVHHGSSMAWEDMSLDSLRKNKYLCQESSINENLDDETYAREDVKLVNTSVS